jgi:hypothetical protein
MIREAEIVVGAEVEHVAAALKPDVDILRGRHRCVHHASYAAIDKIRCGLTS